MVSVKPTRPRLPFFEKIVKPEPPPRKTKLRKDENCECADVADKESLPSNSPHRAESRTSTVTFACSTLERC